MISKDDVKYVAHLSRINLSDKEVEHFTKQLEDILSYINKLKELDISKVAPTAHVFALKNVFREDNIKPSLKAEDVLKIANERQDNFFKVPKVIE